MAAAATEQCGQETVLLTQVVAVVEHTTVTHGTEFNLVVQAAAALAGLKVKQDKMVK